MAEVVGSLSSEASELEQLSRRRAFAHRDNCRFWDSVNLGLGIPAAVVAASAGASALANFDRLIPGLLALSAAILSGLIAFVNPSQNARLHGQASKRYGALDGNFRRFRNIELDLKETQQHQRDRLEELVKRFNENDESSPLLMRRYQRRYKLGWYAETEEDVPLVVELRDGGPGVTVRQ